MFNDVHIAGQQGRGARRIIQQKALIGPRPGLLLTPVAIIAREFHPIPRTIGQQPVRPGADRGLAGIEILAACPFRRVAGDDADRSQVKRHERMRRACVQDQRMRIGRFHLGDGAQKTAKATRAIRHPGLHAREGEDHIIGGEGLAIMPGDTLAKLEFPRCFGQHAPGFRKLRGWARLPITVHQPVKNMIGQRIIRPDIVEMRVNGGDRRAEADRQRLRAWRADGQGQRNQRSQQGFGGVVHGSLPDVLERDANPALRQNARGPKKKKPRYLGVARPYMIKRLFSPGVPPSAS